MKETALDVAAPSSDAPPGPPAPTPDAPARAHPRARRPWWDRIAEPVIETAIRVCGVSAIIFVFLIFFFVFREGAGFLFHGLNLRQFLFSSEWYPTSLSNVRFGVAALIVGTLTVTALAMAIAVPFGLGAAIFVSEFCGKRTKETLKIVIELLAAIPSVVWGFIGISVMNPLIQYVFHVPVGLNAFNGAILLALMSVPIIVSIGEDALKAVPDSFREAALALGATRWQIVYRVLFPAARNGLLAAVLLGVGRAIGETMAVLMATGHAINIPNSPFDPVRTLTATIAAELGEASVGSPHYQVLFIIGLLLFTITFAVNLTADLVVRGNPPPMSAAARFVETSFTRKKRRSELVARAGFGLMALTLVVPLVAIVGYLLVQAWPLLSWDFLVSNPVGGMRRGGIWSALLGTIYLVTLSLAISAPIGVLAAVYLNEYARESWFTRIINLAVVNLAGVPSIVHALFGLGAFVLFAGMGRSILAASLTLSIMTLPVIIASTKEALASVPIAFREACWNVGATRWQTIRGIVLPNSISGILTGVILQVSRTAGETAPVMFTGAVFFKKIEEGDPFAYRLTDQCMALSMHLYTVTTQVTEAPHALPFAIATVLLATVLLVNALSIGLRVYLRSRKKW